MSTRLGFGRAALVLALGLVWTQACTENAPEPTGGLLTDFASGVDADFGVEAFAVNEPSLTINAPTHKQQFAKGATATPVELAFTVAFHDLAADKGKIRCYLDNKEALTTIKTNDAATNTIADLGAPGLKTITCVLLDAAGNKLENPEAFAKRYVYVTKACQVSNECDDGIACSQESCIGNKCLYEPIESCCANSLECNVGETCNSPNTIDAKCSACAGDIDCDDGNACTTDSCDLSGAKGQCKNVKADPECCISADTECDDGLLCTVDKCTAGSPTGKCSHTKPEGVCCADSDCVSTDSCLVGSCVDFECRYGPDVSKPDCCSDTYNTACNDNYVCTIDKCETDKGGWKQCTHSKDPTKPDCCDPFNSTNECQDGNSCTYDVCYNNACVHKEIAECCVSDKDCFDDHLCTTDTCEIKAGDTAGVCKYPKPDPECCVTFLDCDDGLLCTQDTCDTVNNKCKHELVGNGCCDKDEQCDDGKYCTVGQCVNHGCVFGPDITKSACCDANSDCNDNDACTLNSCDVATHTCKYVDNGDSNCCNANEDCDDNNCATLDFCDATNQCVGKADPTKCTTNLECDDQDPCTIDACDKSGDCGTCIHTKDPQCCIMDANCEDGDICTTDVCVDNKCQSSPKANCCIDDADATTACDDSNSCTIEYCANNTCRHTVPKNGCCATSADCFDGDSCTLDKCQNVVDGKGTCAFTKDPLKPDCVCTEQNAAAGLDCNDLNPCTVDSCIGGVCAHTAIDGCCLDKFDCDDSQPCTSDFCVLNGCVHAEYGGENALCCSPATQDTDCAYLNTACSKGVCETQPDNSRACVSQPVDICTVQVSYCQDFATGSTLKAMGWNPGDIAGSAKGNWKLATKGPLGPDQHASLSWTPTYTNYDTCLQSPILQAAGTKTITLQYDQLIDLAKFGDTSVRLLGSLDGANVDWTKATLIDIVTPKADSGPATLDVTLPPELTGSNGLRLAFCVAGKTTFDVTNYGLDNICVAKGGKPSLKACPVNQIVKLFGSKSVPLKASDPDADAILSFSMVQGPSFVTLSSAFYYWFDGTWNSTLTINPQTYADVGTHEITIKVSDGFLYSLCTFKVTVTYEGGYLVWKPSEVPGPVGEALFAALKANVPDVVQAVDDIGLYPDLSKFLGIFITLGVYPDNHVLKESEVGPLKLFLQGGGKLYIESGDSWAFDAKTSLHPFFHVKPQGDASAYGVTGPLKGVELYKDITQSPTKFYAYEYAKDDYAWNNANDQLLADATVKDTRNVLRNDGAQELFWVQVAHDNPANGYRTVASSILFGGVMPGVVDAPGTMVSRIVGFFNNGFIDCSKDEHCDDGDACTTDKCSAQKCTYVNTCTCQGSGPLACAATKAFDSAAGTATDVVENYGCDPGKKYDGAEIAWEFTSDSSRPITLSLSNVTGTDAKVFVLKASDTGCDPAQCIASGSSGNVTFAAAKGAKYFVVLDGTGSGTAKADIAVACGTGEVCDDGQDNNGNNLVDCNDLASCCGDAACGEICDDKDNDCDGKTDEGCDDDGDDYCDSTMTTVGAPAVCPNKGNDCNDDNSSVNPGVLEICGNGKDDNCDGQQDEEGAAGCTNFYVDLDKDGFGTGVPKCLCAASGAYQASKGGDCNDADPKVNPADQPEICGNGLDDDCTGTQNDLNAVGCSDFYTDSDKDGWGTLPKKCLCFGEGATTSTKFGDCDDADNSKNPGKTELCNGKDDDCDNDIDEGCDDDNDGYCDNNLGYEQVDGSKKVCGTANEGASLTLACDTGSTITQVNFASYGLANGTCGNYTTGACHSTQSLQKVKDLCLGKTGCTIAANNTTFGDPCAGIGKRLDVEVICTSSQGQPPAICPKGPGDSDDLDPNVNPAGKEICDGIDNDSNGIIDDGCDDDKDGYCDVTMVVVGAPSSCPKGGGDCDDGKGGVNPGVNESCATPYDDDCDGDNNDLDADACNPFFYDGDADNYGTKDFKCLCISVGKYTAPKTADCDDTDPNVNPGNLEICDGADNNCNGDIDEGCDDDNDGYCDAALKLAAGGAAVCPNGGGDCADDNANVNPGKAEICSNGVDDNCDGSQNDPGATGCVTYYADADGDGYGVSTSKCLCTTSGSFTATNDKDCNDNDKTIKPGTVEVCDGKDNDCDGVTDNGCDDDKDGWCDAGMSVVGSPAICSKGIGDCDDTAASVNPGVLEEVCDGKDDDCDGATDGDCDKDKDGYCDATKTVIGTPAICSKGTGDCNDFNNDQNPGAKEVCGNGIDDDCNNSQNDEGATNCKNFFFDADGDNYGLALSKCLCVSAGLFKAPVGGDCADTNKDVNPAAAEVCGDGLDNNCDGSTNDEGALNCKDFYLDQDGDGYGIAGAKKCMCEAVDKYTASNTGDCNDTNAAVSPGKTEACNNIDDDCDGKVDTGCDDDDDNYCDAAMTTVGFPNICVNGGGDCKDTEAKANPGLPEICDDIDNNCDGQTDEGCDDDNDDYCDAALTTVGTPSTCSKGGGDCKDDNASVNPGKSELCSTLLDDDCSGSTNDEGAVGCKNFGIDADGDNYTDIKGATKCLCVAEPPLTGLQSGDCNDANKLINPAVIELCDGVDNNCNGQTDEGCDADGDGYCSSSKVTIGQPAVCPKGGGDCNDASSSVNPGAKEVCGNATDENCDNDLNGVDATGCTKFYYDADGDGFAVNLALCLCTAKDNYKVTDAGKLGDCDDTVNTIYPGAPEVCGDNKDSNCNGTQNDPGAVGCKAFYKDADKDGYGGTASACLCVAEGEYITAIGGDCNESDVDINPGAAEVCDGKDNNCASGADEGCDDDNDDYCDGSMVTIGAPAVCPKGGQDCDDTKSAINPAATEVCDNLDQDCNGIADDGCDQDNDGYCDINMTIVGTPAICTNGGKDCDDNNSLVNPGKTEICDDADNNCDGQTDEACDADNDGYCTNDKSVIGVPSVCSKGAGDCNDGDANINPGAAEECNSIDDNCAGGIDETCNDNDGDGYCIGNVSVSQGCPKGGGDCNDSDVNVNPGVPEDCNTQQDDNCNNLTNEENALNCVTFFKDTDGDTYGAGTGICLCSQQGEYNATRGGDCDETKPTVHPNANEICDGVNNDCDFVFKEGASPNAKNPITMDTRSHGGGYHHFRKEYWYPGWSGSTIYRYDPNYQYLGSFNGGQSNVMDLDGDVSQDAWYSANWNYYTITRRNGTGTGAVWTRSIGYYAGGVTNDANYVYGFRTNSSSIYVLNKANGSVVKNLNLTPYYGAGGTGLYGGPFVQGDKIWLPNYSSRIFYRYDLATGQHDGTQFQVAPTIYNAAWNGTEICVSSNSNQVYCYAPPATTTDYKPRIIGVDPKSHGGGFSLYHNEYWYPAWSGDTVYRYDTDATPLGTFTSGVPETRQIWGPKEEDAYYAVRYSSSSTNSYVRKIKGKTNQTIWQTPYTTTYLSGVASDAQSVYAMRYNSNTVYQYNVTDGKLAKSFGLSGDYDGDLMYGGLAVVDGKLYRATYNNRNVYRYNVADGVHDGIKFRAQPNVYGTAFNGAELCYSSTSGMPYCYKVPASALNLQPDVIGVNPRSWGGGYHAFRDEYWYPQWSGSTIYRYDNKAKQLGSFNTGTNQMRQVAGDPDADFYYTASYSGSSGTDRIRKYAGTTSSLSWERYITTYMGGVAADANYVYAMRYNNSTVYRLNKSNGTIVNSYNLNSYTGVTSGIGIRNGKLYRSSYNTNSIWEYDATNGVHTGMRINTIVSPYTFAVTNDGRACVSDTGARIPHCYDLAAYSQTAPKATSMQTWSYGGGYHPNRKEWWFPYWSGSTIYRYDANKNPIGSFDANNITPSTTVAFPNSTILDSAAMTKLNAWYGNPNQKWTRCYKRSVDGTSSGTFHSLCDNVGPTMTIIKATNGYVFGGFAISGWSGGGYTGNSNNFLFSLTGNSKHPWYRYGYYQYNNSSYGPCFGGGHDMCVNNSSTAAGYSNLGHSFQCATSGYGSTACRNQFSGSYNWNVADIEVYGLGAGASINSIRQVVGETASNDWYAVRYDSNGSSQYSYVNKYDGLPGHIVWSSRGGSSITGYLHGVALDGNYVYVNRYNSAGVYALRRSDGTRDTSKDFNLTPYMGSYAYGGISIVGGKLYRPASDGYMYRFDVGGGGYDGFRFYTGNTAYAYGTDGLEHCFGFGTGTTTQATCYKMPNDADALVPSRAGVKTGAHGSGYHPYYNEFWFPQYSGGRIERYNAEWKNTGSFDSGLSNLFQVAGETDSPNWYGVQYSSSSTTSRAYKMDGTNNTKVWTSPYVTTYLSGLAVDSDYVYVNRYNNSTVYRLEKSTGSLVNSFNLGGQFSGSAQYGGLAIIGDRMYRTTTDRWVYRYDLSSGQWDGTMFTVAVTPYGMATDGSRLCFHDSNDGGELHCITAPSSSFDYKGRPLGMDSKARGGGFHAFHNEYWYPEWSGSVVYRYSTNYAPTGQHDVGVSSIAQVWGDRVEDAVYVAKYSSSSSDSRVYKIKGKTNNKLWTSPYITTYLGGVAADEQYVYTMPYTSQTVYRLSRANGQQVSSFNLSGVWQGGTMYGTLVVDNGRLYRGSTANWTDAYSVVDGKHTGTSFKIDITPYSAAFNGKEICYGQSSAGAPIYCYSLYTDSQQVDEGCDKDGDGYCDAGNTIADGAQVTCPKTKATCDGVLSGGTCYKAFNSGGNWPAAKKACADWGGVLATASDTQENDVINAAAGAACGSISYWIGATDGDSEGVFKWIDNFQQAQFTKWKTGEPTSKPGTGGGGSSAAQAWSAVSSGGPTVNMGTIPGKAGQRIIIEKIGICGDSDQSSGPNRFNLSGGGLSFSWSAGQSNVSSTYKLSPTPDKGGSARGFSYQSVSYQAAIGAPVTIQWDYHNDWDGRYCQDTDEFGNSYSDGSSTVRAWVRYRYSSNSNGEDYVSSNSDGLWSDMPNSTSLNCYVCERNMTAAQYGNGDDCNDEDPAIGPNQTEVCDGKDNNCNGLIDEECDNDGDGYCDSAMAVIGSPAVCVAGGGDCDDFNNNINPGKQESCLTPFDDNCDGSFTALNAVGCTNLFYDGDADGYGTTSFQCQCPTDVCAQSAWEELFDGTVTGWTYQDCAAGTQTTPTSCVNQTDSKGWQVAKDIMYSSASSSLYYGDKATKSFNFGASAGRAVSPEVTLPSSADLKFKAGVFLGVDADPNTDSLYINILTNNGANRTKIWDKKTGATDTFPGSKIMSATDKSQLNSWYGTPNQKWTLCYQKTRDGASSSTFHSLCDGKGETMVIIKANTGRVFGGYAPVSWNTSNNYIYTGGGWLFSLTSKTKHPYYRYPQYGQYGNNGYGPTWGGGHDLYLNSSMNGGYTYLGHTYNCVVAGYGSSTCQNYLAGNYSSWSTTEVEVYYKGAANNSTVNVWQDVEADISSYAGQKVQFEFYFNTVNSSKNDGLGVSVDNVRVVDGSCNKYSAKEAGDCDDANPLKYPSLSAEACDGIDNNCNGVVDEACDLDGDGYCGADKPVANSPACPKSGTGATTTCTVTNNSTPAYDGKPITMNNYGAHGHTQHKVRSEYWQSNWSSNTTIYRHDLNYKYLGSFVSGVYYTRGLAADPKTDHYYNGEYYNYRVSKRSGMTSTVVWNTGSIGYYTGGVAADDNYVYAMRYNNSTVWVINKDNGSFVKTFGLSGAYGADTHGGVHIMDNKLFRGGSDGWVRGYNLSNGAYAGPQFRAVNNNYRSFIRDNNSWCTDYNGNTFWCYPLKDVICTKGDDCNDQSIGVNPDATEICDGLDNNCNGKIDEGCDDDGDEYCDSSMVVIGTPPTCLQGGGDCNDNSPIENPGSVEVCDGKDNNCDKVIDEAGSQGCQNWFYDGDQDGHGVGTNKLCLCAAAGLYTTKKSDDCDDTCANCKPGGTEICDDKNNDCDGAVDEGCDDDGDDYCDANMITVGKPAVCPKGANDCNDGSTTINPGNLEACNNVDDNCNGVVDENASDNCTTTIPNATAACVAGACKLVGCDPGFYDMNNTLSDGCECNGSDQFEPNDTCAQASTISTNLDDRSGGMVEVFGGRVVDNTDVDWFRIYARDNADGGSTACDNFRLRARFLKNPGNFYRFDIYRGACPANNDSAAKWKKETHRNDAKSFDNQVCCAQTDFNWFTNYKGYTKHGYSSSESEYGQCGCTTTTTRFGQAYGWNLGGGGPYNRLNAATGVYHTTNSTAYGYDFTWCHDDSDWYYIKVHKVAGGKYCGDYLLEVSNGVYTPGIVNGKNW